MNLQRLHTLYREYRAREGGNNPASGFRAWLEEQDRIKPVIFEPCITKSGAVARAHWTVGEWHVKASIMLDETYSDGQLPGEWSESKPPSTSCYYGAPNEPVFRSPGGIKPEPERGNRRECRYWCPTTSAAEHAADLFQCGYSRGEAMRLGLEYVRQDFKRFTGCGETWDPVGIVVKVYREGVLLGEDDLWGIESDAGDYLRSVAVDCAKEAVAEAEEKLAKLTADKERAVQELQGEACRARGDDRPCEPGNPEDKSLCRFCGEPVAPSAARNTDCPAWEHCPGWSIDWLGFVRPCAVCKRFESEEAAATAARAFIASFPVHPEEGVPNPCDPNCRGWAIFHRDGCEMAGFDIERCDDCARFKNDDEALAEATRWLLDRLRYPALYPRSP